MGVEQKTREIIDNAADGVSILIALSQHGRAVWQIGQHGHTWDWFCTLSYKAAWGDVFWKSEHAPTMDEAIRQAAQAWIREVDA
jgi:hypothetical protein